MKEPKFKKGDVLKYMAGNPFNDEKEEAELEVISAHKFNNSFRYRGIDKTIKKEQWIEEEYLHL